MRSAAKWRVGRAPSQREQLESRLGQYTMLASAIDDPAKRARADAITASVRSQLEALGPKRERVRRTADDKPVVPTEYQEQGVVIDWWWKAHRTYGLPVFALFSVPNGAYLASGYAGAAMLKKTGMRRGAPDLILDCARGGYHGLRIEMKRVNATESDKSDEQKAFGEYLASAGYKFQFANGAAAAIAAITAYLS